MNHDELATILKAAGGGENALVYVDALLEKLNCVGSQRQYAPLVAQLKASKEQGDFRGRVLEVNFAHCFIRQGIELEYGVKQGMSGDIDFGWVVNDLKVQIEMKLMGQDKATRDEITSQIENRQFSAKFVEDDSKDIARLQADLIQKATTRKFNPKPVVGTVNLVSIDVSELQLGAIDFCDCLLAAGGNSLAAQYCNPACLRSSVVGAFETIADEKLSAAQIEWVAKIHKIAEGAPHPKSYIHGAIFLFRTPKERAALSYDLRAGIVWNLNLVDEKIQRTVRKALHDVIPSIC